MKRLKHTHTERESNIEDNVRDIGELVESSSLSVNRVHKRKRERY